MIFREIMRTPDQAIPRELPETAKRVVIVRADHLRRILEGGQAMVEDTAVATRGRSDKS